ncbi:hypothetical protein MPF_1192 [Methanohalophilus portucalensis FDF-1]|uniref:Uncharacterized protein n=1 Tax=Methanohalophilus portucalensis FDF-1 TaxID=523843 RepID=A0A1L9C450_9EURY|nr:hypothetical protein MPF_1192 [Methanohalophilus portucalensis FDF-1]
MSKYHSIPTNFEEGHVNALRHPLQVLSSQNNSPGAPPK